MGKSKGPLWLSLCLYCVLFTLSVFLYYYDETVHDTGLNMKFFATIIAPGIFFLISVVFDNPKWMMRNSRRSEIIPLILLPVFISLNFMALTLGFMGALSEAILLWYGLLLLPLLLLVIYIALARKYSQGKIRLFTIIKYGLSIVLFFYGYLLFSAYGLAGLGV